MHQLNIDIETYSETSLKKCGLHKYVEDEEFEILLISFQFDDQPIKTFDLATRPIISREYIDWLMDPNVLKTAWNAPFEILCHNVFFGLELDITQWRDTMMVASMAGYPLSLEECAKALKIEAQKDRRGKALIKYFSEPNKVPRVNPVQYIRRHPKSNLAMWKEYIAYNQMDVLVESQIGKALSWFKYPQREQEFWILDQKINSEGVMLDVQLVDQAIALNNLKQEELVREAIAITGVAKPTSVPQLKAWLEKETGDEIANLQKETIKILQDDYKGNPRVSRILSIREQISKSSIKKYIPMRLCMGTDLRARGLFQFYGANKTGRWSSRLIQLQNLVKNKMADIHSARKLVRDGDFYVLELIYDNIPKVMSELCRTAFTAPPDHELLVTDFSSIEARGLAWIAGEEWKLEVFRGDGKIYEAAGARMFKITPKEVKGEIRAKSKVAELALGYQGSVGALERMGALKMGLTEEELQPLVDAWRAANPKIVKLWRDVNDAAIEAIRTYRTIRLRNLYFFVKNGTLFIKLPSGRCLTYPKVHLREGKWGQTTIGFWGVDQIKKRWCHQETYGGKLVENIVQGTSRDLLAEKMLLFDRAGWKIVMHVHDEIVFEVLTCEKSKKLIEAGELMSRNVPWAEGLPLAAASFTTPYYLKED